MSTPDRHDWSRLNRLQLGKYAEYVVKMEFVLCGCDVFTCEVDDHGIDFVVRTCNGDHYDVQVKSFRLEPGKNTPYVFLKKVEVRNSSVASALPRPVRERGSADAVAGSVVRGWQAEPVLREPRLR